MGILGEPQSSSENCGEVLCQEEGAPDRELRGLLRMDHSARLSDLELLYGSGKPLAGEVNSNREWRGDNSNKIPEAA